MSAVIHQQNHHCASYSALGRKTEHDNHYNPKRLFPIARTTGRREIGVSANPLPFYGFDYWNHFEVSWLNLKGKPKVAIAEIVYDCTSPLLIESKSLKLYFNSLNHSQFSCTDKVCELIKNDLSKALATPVQVTLTELCDYKKLSIQPAFAGVRLDGLDVKCHDYTVNPTLLTVHGAIVEEVLYSDLLKSNCLVTHQPDWGSVQISYKGKQINHEGLLQYIVSFRNHNEFHEQCIERIFVDIMQQCQPEVLTVYGRYTRRGGIDINPLRSTSPVDFNKKNIRLLRQ